MYNCTTLFEAKRLHRRVIALTSESLKMLKLKQKSCNKSFVKQDFFYKNDNEHLKIELFTLYAMHTNTAGGS